MIKTAQKWQIGDCIELMGEMESDIVDFMITDPPFGINYLSNHYVGKNPHNVIENDESINIEFNKKWLDEASRILKPNSAVMIFTRWDVWDVWKSLVSTHWDIKNMIVWVKNNWSAGDLKGNVGNQHELIIFGSRGNFKINGYRYSNVWNFKRVPPTRHPTEKPIRLIERGIELCTNKGDLVLDPFLGSGTTLEAGYLTGRDVLGFEIDPQWEKLYPVRAHTYQGDLGDWF